MPVLDLAPAADETKRLLEAVTDDQLQDPTPCEGMPVAALLDHLMGLSLAFTWAARKTASAEGGRTPPGPGSATAEALDPAWRQLLPQRLDELVIAWRDPSAWEGMTQAGGIDLPGEVAGLVALDEQL